MLNNKIHIAEKISKEFVEQGLIPVGSEEQFAESLTRELIRETMRFGGDVASATAKGVWMKGLTSNSALLVA